MDMDFEQSFTYIAKDGKWKKKLIVGGMLSLLALISLLFPIGFNKFMPNYMSSSVLFCLCTVFSVLIYLAILGYLTITAHNRIKCEDELPSWDDFGKLLAAGCKNFVGHILCFLPFGIITGFMLIMFLIPYMIPNPILASLLSILTVSISMMGVFFVSLLLLIFYYLLLCNFFRDLKILSFINFKGAIGLVKNNVVNYLIFYLLIIVISIIVQAVSLVLICTIVGILLLPLLFFYFSLVTVDLMAQFINTAKE